LAATGATNAAADETSGATAGAVQPVTMQTLELMLAFIAFPYLRDALFNERTTDPLELIILACEAATDFQNHHQSVVGFQNMSAHNHVDAFTNWAFTIKLGLLGKVRYTINPDNEELQDFAARRHENCILPQVRGGTSSGTGSATSSDDTTAVFKTLSKGLKRMGKAADETNILKKEEMRLKGKADALKKDRRAFCSHTSNFSCSVFTNIYYFDQF
jgi:hypothetical protein